MPDVAGYVVDLGGPSSGLTINVRAGGLVDQNTATPGAAVSYRMRALDDGAGYVTWVSSTADFAGAGFPGGTPTPVGSMVAGSAVVIGTWES